MRGNSVLRHPFWAAHFITLALALGPVHAELGPASDILDVYRIGSRQAVDGVRSGMGEAVVRITQFRAGNVCLDIERNYILAFADKKMRASITERFLSNASLGDAGKALLIPAGTVRERRVFVDGDQVTMLEGGRAVIGNGCVRHSQAEIWRDECVGYFGRSSARGTSTVGHGLIDLGAVEKTFVGGYYVGARTTVCEPEVIDGRPCTRVDLLARGDHKRGIADRLMRYWFDRERGFVTPRVQAYYEGGPYTSRFMSHECVSEYRESVGGFWCPRKTITCRYALDSAGNAYKSEEVTITYADGFQFNCLPPGSALTLALPAGTKVYDENLDAVYTVP